MGKIKLREKVLLSYSVVFPDRHDRIESLLNTVPSATAIESISYYLSKRMNMFVGEHEMNIWVPWIMKTRSDVRNRIGQYAQRNNLANMALIDSYAMLLLISKLLSNYNGRHDELTENDISNLLLAYMICCDERLSLNNAISDDNMDAEKYVKAYLPNALKTYDMEFPRDYRLMLIKCYCLLIEFPKHNTKFAAYLDIFCKERGLPASKAYLDHLFKIFLELSSNGNFSTTLMEVDPVCNDTIHFLDSFSINTELYFHDMDFKMIREKPVLKTGTHRYDFMFMKMFLDKAYTGFLFDMKDVLVKRRILDEKNGYMDLRSLLGEEFSERFFFYSLMKRCFGNRYVKYDGEELEKKFGKGMPDYYMRRGNRIFVFECKDAQIASRIKLSGDYEIIKNAIFEKYVVNVKGHSKGISQLAKVIKEKLADIVRDVDNAAPKGTKYVFPIIIYFDECFDIEGPSYLLNNEFEKMVDNVSCSADFVVKDVVMINIESLMMLEDFFENDKLMLASIINSYIDFKSREDIYQVFPFNKFLFHEAKKKGFLLKKTKWFDEVYQNLIALDKKVIQ